MEETSTEKTFNITLKTTRDKLRELIDPKSKYPGEDIITQDIISNSKEIEPDIDWEKIVNEVVVKGYSEYTSQKIRGQTVIRKYIAMPFAKMINSCRWDMHSPEAVYISTHLFLLNIKKTTYDYIYTKKDPGVQGDILDHDYAVEQLMEEIRDLKSEECQQLEKREKDIEKLTNSLQEYAKQNNFDEGTIRILQYFTFSICCQLFIAQADLLAYHYRTPASRKKAIENLEENWEKSIIKMLK